MGESAATTGAHQVRTTKSAGDPRGGFRGRSGRRGRGQANPDPRGAVPHGGGQSAQRPALSAALGQPGVYVGSPHPARRSSLVGHGAGAPGRGAVAARRPGLDAGGPHFLTQPCPAKARLMSKVIQARSE
jgi:hypothetical protein